MFVIRQNFSTIDLNEYQLFHVQCNLFRWQPGFDHNLRDKAGNTPLMVACQVGVSEIISFLLQSAVYPQSLYEDDDAM